MNHNMLSHYIQAGDLAQYHDALLSVVTPAIHLTPYVVETDIPIGSTKLGGLPDLPPDVAWPVVDGILLEFVGQFRLADLAPYDIQGDLPKTGMLYFFFDGMLTGYDQGEGKDRRAVLYYDGPFDTLARCAEPVHAHGYRFNVYRACPLRLKTTWTLPPFEELDDDEFSMFPAVTPILPSTMRRPYHELRKPLRDFSHRLLGHPDEVQGGEMRLHVAQSHDPQKRFTADRYGNYVHREELVTAMRQWHLLAQFASERNTNMCWGDGGVIHFWIRKADLAARRFDQVFARLDSP